MFIYYLFLIIFFHIYKYFELHVSCSKHTKSFRYLKGISTYNA